MNKPDSNHQIGPPRLVDFNCSVQERVNGTAACHLALTLEKDRSIEIKSTEQDISSVNMELEPGTLGTLLDGLGRIRDQLSSVTNKKVTK